MGKREVEANYNRAKLYQLIMFPFNNIATNVYFLYTFFISYLAVGGYGLAVATAGLVAAWTRIFDGITDPLIGFLIDKTETKIGKFRPMIIIGWIIQTISLAAMVFIFVEEDGPARLLIYILLYGCFIIGYTFQTACTKSAQTCITNDPTQRPLFTRVDAIMNMALFSGSNIYISKYLQPKYGKINVPAMQEFLATGIILSFALTVMALIALWKKDIPENWGIGEANVKAKFSDYIEIIKTNRAIQMLVVAASTDKLAMTAAGEGVVAIMLFGIVAGNYGFWGYLSGITMIPLIILIIVGTQYASKRGAKRTLVITTWLNIILGIMLISSFFIFEPSKIVDYKNMSFATIIFIGLYIIYKGTQSISSGIVIPMIADCADYETYLSGRYVPGMMGTLFSFVDKMISSLGKLIVAWMIGLAGYKTVNPQVGDEATTSTFIIAITLMFVLPILGWIASLIAMKFYPLTREKMLEIQAEMDARKHEREGIAAEQAGNN